MGNFLSVVPFSYPRLQMWGKLKKYVLKNKYRYIDVWQFQNFTRGNILYKINYIFTQSFTFVNNKKKFLGLVVSFKIVNLCWKEGRKYPNPISNMFSTIYFLVKLSTSMSANHSQRICDLCGVNNLHMHNITPLLRKQLWMIFDFPVLQGR